MNSIWNKIVELPQLVWSKFNDHIYIIKQSLVSLGDWLSDIWDKIVELPQLVWSKFNDHIWTIKDWLRQTVEGIVGLPDAIGEMLKSLFVPSENYFESKFSEIKNNFSNRVGIDVGQLEVLKNTSSVEFEDISADVMGVHVKIVDFSSLNKYLTLFRGWIKGFVAVLLVFYNVDMAYFMIRGTHVLTASGWREKK